MSKYLVIEGDKFGSLTVIIASAEKHKSLCKCICGLEKLIRTSDLVTGRTKSCGKRTCYFRFTDLTSLRFGFLSVIEQTNDRYTNGSIIWKCECICGKICFISSKHLVTGATKSCGCQKSKLLNESHLLLSEEERAVRKVFSDYKRGAKERNLNFELTLEQFTDLIKMNCFYCNSLPYKTTVIKRIDNTILFNHNGIDRKNSKIGYIIDNCVACCWFCNRAKLDSSIKEFVEWLEKIYFNYSKLKESIK